MKKENIVELVEKIQSAIGTEEEIHQNIILFKSLVKDPNAVDYIFSKKYEHLSAEEIVEKALSYKVTLLLPPLDLSGEE